MQASSFSHTEIMSRVVLTSSRQLTLARRERGYTPDYVPCSWLVTPVFRPKTSQNQKRTVPHASPSGGASNEMLLDEI